jgi:hypothetical protein
MAEESEATMRDEYGRAVDPAERQQELMLAFFDLVEEAGDANFSAELVAQLKQLRLKFIEQFERDFPGYGKGRAIWR